MTPKRRVALRKAQLASARARKRTKAISPKNKRRIAIGVGTAAVLGVAAGAYSIDRKRNTMMVYHATTHHRARQIHKKGYQTKHRKRAYGNYSGTGPMHETGRVFVSTRAKSIKQYGPGLTSARVRKKKFYKYAKQDVHPQSLRLRKMGIIAGHEYSSHYNLQVKDMKKAGVRLRYKKQARIVAGKRIRTRYEQGSYKSFYE